MSAAARSPERPWQPIDHADGQQVAAATKEELEHAAIHEAAHAVVLAALLGAAAVQRVSLCREGGETVPAPGPAGAVEGELVARAAAAYAGLAAERLLLGWAAEGSAEDIAAATRLLVRHVDAGLHGGRCLLSAESLPRALEGPVVRRTARSLRRAARTALGQAESLVLEHAEAIQQVAAALGRSRVLEDAQLVEVLSRAGFGQAPRSRLAVRTQVREATWVPNVSTGLTPLRVDPGHRRSDDSDRQRHPISSDDRSTTPVSTQFQTAIGTAVGRTVAKAAVAPPGAVGPATVASLVRHELSFRPLIHDRRRGELLVSGSTSKYLRRYRPDPDWTLLGREVDLGTGRADLVWCRGDAAHPAEVLVDELKVERPPKTGLDEAHVDQLIRYLEGAKARFGCPVSVRIVFLGAPSKQLSFTSADAIRAASAPTDSQEIH